MGDYEKSIFSPAGRTSRKVTFKYTSNPGRQAENYLGMKQINFFTVFFKVQAFKEADNHSESLQSEQWN